LVGLYRPRGIGEEEAAGVAVEQAAADAATRLPVSILQTLLAIEELTIPGPKVDDDHREVHMHVRANHHLITRFVLAVRFPRP
jgi:hypothetical protein